MQWNNLGMLVGRMIALGNALAPDVSRRIQKVYDESNIFTPGLCVEGFALEVCNQTELQEHVRAREEYLESEIPE